MFAYVIHWALVAGAWLVGIALALTFLAFAAAGSLALLGLLLERPINRRIDAECRAAGVERGGLGDRTYEEIAAIKRLEDV